MADCKLIDTSIKLGSQWISEGLAIDFDKHSTFIWIFPVPNQAWSLVRKTCSQSLLILLFPDWWKLLKSFPTSASLPFLTAGPFITLWVYLPSLWLQWQSFSLPENLGKSCSNLSSSALKQFDSERRWLKRFDSEDLRSECFGPVFVSAKYSQILCMTPLCMFSLKGEKIIAYWNVPGFVSLQLLSQGGMLLLWFCF